MDKDERRAFEKMMKLLDTAQRKLEHLPTGYAEKRDSQGQFVSTGKKKTKKRTRVTPKCKK